MAAMMFPSLAPTIALYSRMARDRLAPLLFTAGYLVAWGTVGLTAFAIARASGGIAGDVLAWDRAGRWVAGATLLTAAAYELTPLKDVCLRQCRSPLGFLLGSWRGGRAGALRMGVRHGAWCVGCFSTRGTLGAGGAGHDLYRHGLEPVQPDHLDQRVDVRLGVAQAQDPLLRPKALREHREVEHHRGVGEVQLGQVDDHVALVGDRR
jgi:hypothetical protein